MVKTHPPIPPPATFGSAAAGVLTGAAATIHRGDGGVFELILIGALFVPVLWLAIFMRQGEGFRRRDASTGQATSPSVPPVASRRA